MNKKIGKCLIFAGALSTLVSCNNVNEPEDNDEIKFYDVASRKELAKVVYNACLSEEGMEPVEIDTESLRPIVDDFVYSDIKVDKSFMFSTELNLSLLPFFSEDLTGKTVDVIIAEIELKKDENKISANDYWYRTDMIVFTYNDEINGFLAPYLSLVTDSNKDTFEYYFASSQFLTETQIVKYYEEDETVYCFDLNIQDTNAISFESSSFVLTGSSEEYGKMNVNSATYKTLSSDVALSLVNASKIEEIETSATVTKFENDVAYVISETTPSLKTIEIRPNAFLTLNGEPIVDNPETDLIQPGDIIEFSYYSRYKTYVPVDIFITKGNIVREIVETQEETI